MPVKCNYLSIPKNATIEWVYDKLPRLRDEVRMAKLCSTFYFSEQGSFNQFCDALIDAEFEPEDVMDMDYEFFEDMRDFSQYVVEDSGEKDAQALSLCDKYHKQLDRIFDELHEAYSAYFPGTSKSSLFNCLVKTADKSDIWLDLYDNTYEPMVECINRSSTMDRHIAYINEPFMTMVVNTTTTIEGDAVSEHIYIAKGASFILRKHVLKLETGLTNDKRVSYHLHKSAISKFRPKYMYTNPLSSIRSVLSDLEKDGLVVLIWDKFSMTNGIPIGLNAEGCEPARMLYKITLKPNTRTRRRRRNSKIMSKRTTKTKTKSK